MLHYVTSYYGDPGTTVSAASTNTAQALSATTATLTSGTRRVSSVLITVETKGIRGAFGSTPTTSLGHLFSAGDALRLFGPEVTQFQFISAVAGEHATLQITPYFE